MRLSAASVLFLVLFGASSLALAETVEPQEEQDILPEELVEPPRWWTPAYMIDYGIILAGGVGYLAGEFIEPRQPARIGPAYDPENPEEIFTHPSVSRTYLEEGTEESVPTLWVEIGVGSSVLFVAAFEGAHWAFGQGSGLAFHHALMGSLESTALTGATTSLSKVFFGRLRPDFGERALRYHCPREPDRFGEACDGFRDQPLHEDPVVEEKLLRDGQKSFISGHSSHGYNLFTYAALVVGGRYVWGQDATATSRAVAIPVQVAMVSAGSWFAVSRLVDGRHHLGDVVVGSLVGIGFANLSYWRRFHLDGTPRLYGQGNGRDFELSFAPMHEGGMVQLSFTY